MKKFIQAKVNNGETSNPCKERAENKEPQMPRSSPPHISPDAPCSSRTQTVNGHMNSYVNGYQYGYYSYNNNYTNITQDVYTDYGYQNPQLNYYNYASDVGYNGFIFPPPPPPPPMEPSMTDAKENMPSTSSYSNTTNSSSQNGLYYSVDPSTSSGSENITEMFKKFPEENEHTVQRKLYDFIHKETNVTKMFLQVCTMSRDIALYLQRDLSPSVFEA